MDNMGEAADLHRGIWDTSIPIGTHYSVTKSLPRMLSLLSKYNITSTYFIESWNCKQYPQAIKSVSSAGHEIGWHAFQHEVWKSLDESTEVGNLDKSVQYADSIGVKYKGFRPPGGLVTDRTLGLMKDKSMFYLSPAAERPAVVDGVAMVPFRWREIDAYFYLPSCAPLRKARDDPEDVLDASVLEERLLKRVDEIAEEGGYSAFLFHPFLTDDEKRLAVMEKVLSHLEGKGIWVAPCHEVAEWILKHPEAFGTDPGWDTAEWKKK